jgi:hypothetical protein
MLFEVAVSHGQNTERSTTASIELAHVVRELTRSPDRNRT